MAQWPDGETYDPSFWDDDAEGHFSPLESDPRRSCAADFGGPTCPAPEEQGRARIRDNTNLMKKTAFVCGAPVTSAGDFAVD